MTDTTSPLRENDLILFEGDSLSRRTRGPTMDTWAFARMNNWDHSFGEIAEEWLFSNLPHMRLRVRHAAAGGSRVSDLLARYEQRVRPMKPNWIVLTIGSNDAMKDVPLDAFEASLQQYVSTAQADSNARFLYAGGFFAMPGLDDAGTGRLEKCQPYYDRARRVIRAAGGLTPHMGRAMLDRANAHAAASSHHTYYADGVHLNALANHVLASLVLQTLGCYQLLAPLPRAEM